jgi:hypothetical protein
LPVQRSIVYRFNTFKNGKLVVLIMTLEGLRSRAYFQNTIDIWIMYCEERRWDWINIEHYRRFISYLREKKITMQKFPLCIKEAGGAYGRGRDKAKFADSLSLISSDDAAAYTIKLSPDVLSTIRSFDLN